MAILKPSNDEYNLYVDFVNYLNQCGGRLTSDDGRYYTFLDSKRVVHETLVRAINLTVPDFEDKRTGIPYVLYRNGKNSTYKKGEFFLTSSGTDICCNLPQNRLPQKRNIKIDIPELIIDVPKPIIQEQKQEQEWTRDKVVHLLTCEAHMVGRMLGTGYDLLEPIHSEWIKQWVINPYNFKVMVHQGHRNSYKSSCLRLAIAIILILQPKKTIILLRKSEDAVKELINGVSKILDTDLFKKFVSILSPEINGKGGFKKTTDTALAIDTNLNTSLTGEFQLRGLGLGSPLTGKHAVMIITDDICSLEDRQSAAERMYTISRYQELMNVLSTDKGFQDSCILNIGTPWHEEDVFSLMDKGLKPKSDLQKKIEETESKDRTPTQKDLLRHLDMKRGKFVYNCYQTGLMSNEDIEWKKQTLNDDALFQANYLLNLVSDKEKLFQKIDNVGHYSQNFFTSSAYNVVAHIDASFGGEDSTALTIGADDYENNNVVVLGKLYEESLEDNYLELAEVMFECGVSLLYLETNADKGLMGDKFRELGFEVVGYHESTNKHTKIRSTIRPYWRLSGAELLPSVQFVSETDESYLNNIWEYKKGVKHDDAPDSLASLLLKAKFSAMPVRVW